MSDPLKTLRRARKDFTFAAAMFAATAGSAFWMVDQMDEGGMLDVHERVPATVEAQDFANFAERVLLVPCAAFPLLSALNLRHRRRKYEEAKAKVPGSPALTP